MKFNIVIMLLLSSIIISCLNGKKANAEEYNYKSVIAFENENFEEAIILVTKAINLHKKESYYFNRANAYYHIDNYDKAIEDFAEAIELYKNSEEFLIKHYHEILYAKGKAYQKANQHINAIKDFSEYIFLDSLNADIYFVRGNSYSLIDSFSLATQDYDASLKLNYNKKDISIFRAPILFFSSKYDEALDDLNNVLNNEDTISENYYLLIMRRATLIELEDYQKGLNDLEPYIKYKPEDAVAYLLMAVIHHKLGNFNLADNFYSKADSLKAQKDLSWELYDTFIYYSTNIKSILKEWGKL